MPKFLPYTVAATTPFTKEGAFDPESVPNLIKYMIEAAEAPGLLVCGSTGEQHLLTIDERLQLYTIVREVAGKDYVLYAGVAAFSTPDAIKLAHGAVANGYNGIMLGFPPYRVPTQEQAFQYAKEVCNAIPETPIFIYNNPKRTGFDLSLDTFVKMTKEISNIFGLKHAACQNGIPDVLPKFDREIQILSGFDSSLVNDFNLGYTALTSVVGNILPKECKELIGLLLTDKDHKQIATLQTVIKEVSELINAHGALPCIKYILRKRGVAAGYCSPPLVDPSKDVQNSLDRFI